MASSISDTTHSPGPFSPFTTHSGGSDLATSDGAYATAHMLYFFCVLKDTM